MFALRRRRWPVPVPVLVPLVLRCGAGEAVVLARIGAAGASLGPLAWEGEDRGEAKEAVDAGWRGGGCEGVSMR